MTIWFTSDTHFGHSNIMFYAPERAELWATDDIKEIAREYAKTGDGKELKHALSGRQDSLQESIQNMNNGLVHNWNSRVMPGDAVYHLGDFMMGSSTKWEAVLKRLNGSIMMLKGNHDHKFVKQEYVKDRLVWLKDDFELRVDDPDGEGGKAQRICLHHFPKFVWDKGHRGAWHFHGHCHGSVDKHNTGTRIDVGVDSEHGQYYPRSYAELKKTMSKRKYVAIDHHNDPRKQ